MVLARIHAELTGCQAPFSVHNVHELIQSPNHTARWTLKAFAIDQIFPVAPLGN